MKHYLNEAKAAYKEHKRAFIFTAETIRVAGKAKKYRQSRQDMGKRYFPKLETLFVHIPKTAGTSTESLLYEAEKTRYPCQYTDTEPGSLHQHAKASEWKQHIGKDNWRACFSFCFVRNPWDLMVSSYLWWCQHGIMFRGIRPTALQIRKKGFYHFIHSDYGRFYLNEIHGRSLSEWYSDGERDLVDFIGRYETYRSDIRHICQKIGLEPSDYKIPFENTTLRSNYRQYYSQVTRDIIADRFCDVIERFGYKF